MERITYKITDILAGEKLVKESLTMVGDNSTIELAVDFTGTDYEAWEKRCDLLMADGTEDILGVSLVVTDIIAIWALTSAHTKKGALVINPYCQLDGARKGFPKKSVTIETQLSHSSITAFIPEEVLLTNKADGDILIASGNRWINSNYLTVPRFNDIVFEFTPTRVDPTTSKPDFDYTNVGLLFPQNIPTEAIYITVQLPHSWKEGTTIFPHVHVRQSANQQAVFKVDYLWYNTGDTIPTVWETYTMNEYAIPYVSGSIAQIVKGANGIVATGKEISSILKIKLYRDDNVYVGDMLSDQFDIHIEIDAFGSRTQYEK